MAEIPRNIPQNLLEYMRSGDVVYSDRGYPMVIFSTVIPNLAQQVEAMIGDLGFCPHLYRTRQDRTSMSVKYQVRLSQNVPAFLALVNPLKA